MTQILEIVEPTSDLVADGLELLALRDVVGFHVGLARVVGLLQERANLRDPCGLTDGFGAELLEGVDRGAEVTTRAPATATRAKSIAASTRSNRRAREPR